MPPSESTSLAAIKLRRTAMNLSCSESVLRLTFAWTERPGRADLPWLSGAVQLTLNRLSFRHRALKKKSFSFVALLPDGGNAHAIQAQPATHLSRNILSDYPGSLCFPGDPQCQQQPEAFCPAGQRLCRRNDSGRARALQPHSQSLRHDAA